MQKEAMEHKETDFDIANKIEHPVEKEWHYPIMTKFGFKAITKIGIGFVRSYLHAKEEHQFKLTTGYHSDYWQDLMTEDTGYPSTLKEHLELQQAKNQ